ncbi:DUF2332 domain-containing protein [Minwuia sp.]|uniref:DUF2332 domain-containing protein n=1 Tax=Minwuia sp. TaxID=2493630 RepID=UPI003A8EED19
MGELVQRHFVRQGEVCESMGSPFTGRLLRLAAERLTPSTGFAKAILDWPDGRMIDDALALRFAGSLHALVLSGRDPALAAVYAQDGTPADDDALWQAVSDALSAHDDFLGDFLHHAPQTNETGRSAVLLLGFQQAARDTGMPLHMLELGASAGLNQNWDRFHYRLGKATWGPEDSGVRLRPDWRGPAPDLQPITKSASYACDRHPLDITDPEKALRLRSYVWADQPERLARLDAAIAIAAERGAKVARADAADWIAASLALRPGGCATVVYHSIFWQYMPRETQHAARSAIEVAGDLSDERAPLCWVRMEPYEDDRRKAALYYTHWPDPERRILAFCDYHGRWIEPVA